jgi:hypothetical protein
LNLDLKIVKITFVHNLIIIKYDRNSKQHISIAQEPKLRGTIIFETLISELSYENLTKRLTSRHRVFGKCRNRKPQK